LPRPHIEAGRWAVLDCGLDLQWCSVKVLIVKLSSLGDVVHAMPAVQDIRIGLPAAQIDWAVEGGFAALVQRCDGVGRVIATELRRWRQAPLSAQTRAEWRVFRRTLRGEAYDAVIDLQGLTKSALVSRVARLAATGRRYAMANQTEGSSYESPTRWVADVAVPMPAHIHAVQRSRELCAMALGYALPPYRGFGLAARADGAQVAIEKRAKRCVALAHGSSRTDKSWPEAHWIELGRQLLQGGFTVGLPHGNQAEQERSDRIAAALGPGAQVWPRLDLGAIVDRLAGCVGAIGVDSGLSHIAVALGIAHVQIYNFDTAWRTGPVGAAHQCSVYAHPTPGVGQVWAAWEGAVLANSYSLVQA
jgi:heptosyltransferase-1